MLTLLIKTYFRKNKWIISTTISTLFILLIYIIMSFSELADAEEEPIVITVPVYVLVHPNNTITFSSETIATINSIKFKEGERFKKDDILLTFDCRAQEGDLEKAKAQLDAAASAAKSADKMKLYGLISENDYIKAQSELKSANGDIEKTAAAVDKCTIKAPFNGGIAEVPVHIDETVKPGEPLIKIVSTDDLELEMQVPSAWLTWLKIGSPFLVALNETKTKIIAKVTKINPEIDPVSQTVKIVGIPETPNHGLLPGMSGQAIFKENQEGNTSQKSSTSKSALKPIPKLLDAEEI